MKPAQIQTPSRSSSPKAIKLIANPGSMLPKGIRKSTRSRQAPCLVYASKTVCLTANLHRHLATPDSYGNSSPATLANPNPASPAPSLPRRGLHHAVARETASRLCRGWQHPPRHRRFLQKIDSGAVCPPLPPSYFECQLFNTLIGWSRRDRHPFEFIA